MAVCRRDTLLWSTRISAADACLPTIIHLAVSLMEDCNEMFAELLLLSLLLSLDFAIVMRPGNNSSASFDDENISFAGADRVGGSDIAASGGMPTSSSRLFTALAMVVISAVYYVSVVYVAL
jgi:hypothetical protein